MAKRILIKSSFCHYNFKTNTVNMRAKHLNEHESCYKFMQMAFEEGVAINVFKTD